MTRCAGCPQLRSKVVGLAPRICKGKVHLRLCRQVERSLVELTPGLTLQKLKELGKIAEDAHRKLAGGTETWPDTFESFEGLLKRWHHHIFCQVLPKLAGQYRMTPGSFGFGSKSYEAVAPDRIRSELMALHDSTGSQLAKVSEQTEAIHTAAFFLERYFMIHPFPDGNGRTGRLMAAAILRNRGVELSAKRPDAKEQRDYTNALNYAHIHCPENGHPKAQPHKASKYLNPLHRWFESRVIPPAENLEELFPEED